MIPKKSILVFATISLVLALNAYGYIYNISHICHDNCLENTNVSWNITLYAGIGGSMELKRIEIVDAKSNAILGLYNDSAVIVYSKETFIVNGVLPLSKNSNSINVTPCFTTAIPPKDRMAGAIFIGTELTYCEKSNYTTPVYECVSSKDCEATDVCVNNTCSQLQCSPCQYIADNTCIDYECCKNEQCGQNEKCEENVCITISCLQTQTAINHTCVELKCNENEIAINHTCTKLRCGKNETAVNHKCVKLSSGLMFENEAQQNSTLTEPHKNTAIKKLASSFNTYQILEIAVLTTVAVLLLLLIKRRLVK
jgi:hypothetical protein